MATWKMAKKVPKDKIQQQAQAQTQVTGKLSALEKKVLSLSNSMSGGSADQDNPFVSLKYFRDTFECFSAWEKGELKSLSDFINTMRDRTWRQVLETSGKSQKNGLAYTPYIVADVHDGAAEHLTHVRQQIGDDITFFELRVNQKMRVHGFRAKAAFFLVLLDREHRVFPQ